MMIASKSMIFQLVVGDGEQLRLASRSDDEEYNANVSAHMQAENAAILC